MQEGSVCRKGQVVQPEVVGARLCEPQLVPLPTRPGSVTDAPIPPELPRVRRPALRTSTKGPPINSEYYYNTWGSERSWARSCLQVAVN
jgi:hypothetical protein